MRVVEQGWQFEQLPNQNSMDILKHLERAGRTAHKSNNKAAVEGSAEAVHNRINFIEKLIDMGHESVLEHANISVRIWTDRGISHEIVRHRLASYTQESTRYVRYDKDHMEFIRPVWLSDVVLGAWDIAQIIQSTGDLWDDEFAWLLSCSISERDYIKFCNTFNWSPQKARNVLNHSLKTELVMTANLREWRHFFKLRTSAKAHPQIKCLAESMLAGFRNAVPVVFGDINNMGGEKNAG